MPADDKVSVEIPSGAVAEPLRATATSLTASDLSAIGTLEIAQELGLDVPSQLSIIGFDDIPESALTNPPLSTVHQPLREKGRAGTRLLLRMLAGEERPRALLPTRLVVRGSTAER